MSHLDVESRLALLEYRVNQLMELVDPDRDPFVFHCMEANLNQGQVKALFDLMDQVQASLSGSTPMNHSEFESRVYEIVPSHHGNYHFAEGIVSTLNRTSRYQAVYKHMQADGMNIS